MGCSSPVLIRTLALLPGLRCLCERRVWLFGGGEVVTSMTIFCRLNPNPEKIKTPPEISHGKQIMLHSIWNDIVSRLLGIKYSSLQSWSMLEQFSSFFFFFPLRVRGEFQSVMKKVGLHHLRQTLFETLYTAPRSGLSRCENPKTNESVYRWCCSLHLQGDLYSWGIFL